MTTYIGIDNGVTGSIGIVGDVTDWYKMPVKTEQNYTKSKQNVTRINHRALGCILSEISIDVECKVLLERPFVNPKGFKATSSALRALESTLIVLETLKLPFEYIDSKEWQRVFLPKNLGKKVVGKNGKVKYKATTAELKKASLDMGKRLFPQIELKGDADAMLIAEYLRRKNCEANS